MGQNKSTKMITSSVGLHVVTCQKLLALMHTKVTMTKIILVIESRAPS